MRFSFGPSPEPVRCGNFQPTGQKEASVRTNRGRLERITCVEGAHAEDIVRKLDVVKACRWATREATEENLKKCLSGVYVNAVGPRGLRSSSCATCASISSATDFASYTLLLSSRPASNDLLVCTIRNYTSRGYGEAHRDTLRKERGLLMYVQFVHHSARYSLTSPVDQHVKAD